MAQRRVSCLAVCGNRVVDKQIFKKIKPANQKLLVITQD